MAAEEGGKEFGKDQCEPLIDLALSDSTELWLLQWPYKQDLDFDGQEVSLQLDQDGTLGTFTGTSGKEYELVSYKFLDADATVFVSSASESKIVGKISRRVSFAHYPESGELEMYDPDKVKEERDRELYERTVKYAVSRSHPSMSRSTFMTTTPNSRSRQTNSSRSSKHRSGVSEAGTPSRSSGKRHSSDRSTQDSKRGNSGLTFSGSSGNSQPSKLKKVKLEQE
uniref:Mediator-associated protein 2 n=1 Tax=Kalanchoe fedtschenkoi TaxID=63787 RepID=A0A7N0U9B3_KALFE